MTLARFRLISGASFEILRVISCVLEASRRESSEKKIDASCLGSISLTALCCSVKTPR